MIALAIIVFILGQFKQDYFKYATSGGRLQPLHYLRVKSVFKVQYNRKYNETMTEMLEKYRLASHFRHIS